MAARSDESNNYNQFSSNLPSLSPTGMEIRLTKCEKLTYHVTCLNLHIHFGKRSQIINDFLPFDHREACLYKLTCEWNKKSQSKIR